MQRIQLSRGLFALVDDADFERVSQYKWTADRNGYVVRKQTIAPKQYRKVMLHRFILDAPAGMDVDHRNGDKLDNRRCNIRLATRSQNTANTRPKPNSTSRYKGVCREARKSRWRADICCNGRSIWLGYFKHESEAAQAYDRKAFEFWGEFAYLNFPLTPTPEPAP